MSGTAIAEKVSRYKRVGKTSRKVPTAEIWIASHMNDEKEEGAWGYLMNFGYPISTHEAYGRVRNTNSDRVEIISLYKALDYLKVESNLIIHSSSLEVVRVVGTGSFDDNHDLWMPIFKLRSRHTLGAVDNDCRRYTSLVRERCLNWGMKDMSFEEDSLAK